MNWKSKDELGQTIVEAAVNSCFFPLYEVEHGITTVTYDPESKNKRLAVSEWLKLMGKTKHLLNENSKDMLEMFDKEVDRRWNMLKAKHESPYL